MALCLTSLAGLARTQAPHDGEQGCLDDSSHPQYDDHVRHLLDTRDYSKLLPYDSDAAGGVWQTLDSDGDGVKVRRNYFCWKLYYSCILIVGSQQCCILQ